ncbi:MAG: hypothetical protein EON51_16790 [Acinetobacter sp.]|nr:MAG: hypothetical protein EON51_16790 [Acinetobacter sp.]
MPRNSILRKLILLFSLILLAKKTTGAEGCLIGSTTNGTLYGGSYTTPLFSPRIYTGSSPYPIACPANSSVLHGTDLQQVLVFIFAVDCRIGTSGPSGTVYTFNLVPCPIDDYIPFLLLAAGGLGFFYLRKKA